MTLRLPSSRPGSRRRRGSTLLIVLGVLSVMILFVIALTYTSKLELLTSKNYAEQVQVRTVGLTNVSGRLPLTGTMMPGGPLGPLDLAMNKDFLARRPGPLADHASLDAIYRPMEGTPSLLRSSGSLERLSAVTAMAPRPFAPLDLRPVLPANGAVVEVQDASSRINLNTAPAVVLQVLLTDAAQRANASINAAQVAQRIVTWRLGADGAPGVAGVDDDGDEEGTLLLEPRVSDAALRYGEARNSVSSLLQPTHRDGRLNDASRQLRFDVSEQFFGGKDERDEYIADIRRPAYGDDRRLGSLQDLFQFDGITPEILAALDPFVTVFSVSQEGLFDGREVKPLLDLNRATAAEIYEALVRVYGTAKDDTLLRQFAANVVDARDADRAPTVLPLADGLGRVIGFERTPYMVEVYAQPRNIELQTTDGQYLQLFNPWAESFDLTGWRLEGAGGTVPLNGSIPSRGFLIVTNDKDNRNDPDQQPSRGEGSLYDIFGTVESGPARRIIEFRPFRIPNAEGAHTLQLYSREGDLVDEFRFQITEANGAGILAHKRSNPAVRDVFVASATPFRLHNDGVLTGDPELQERLRTSPADAPFVSILDLFDVFSGYANPDGTEAVRYAFPALAGPNSRDAELRMIAEDPLRLDARMVDLFTVETTRRRTMDQIAADLLDADGLGTLQGPNEPGLGRYLREANRQRTLTPEETRTAQWDRYLELPAGLRQGLVNINTAPAEVLTALPGMDSRRVGLVLQRRAMALTLAQQGYAHDGLVFRAPSELLTDDEFWGPVGRDWRQRLADFDQLHAQVTWGSKSFILVARPGDSAQSSGSESVGPRFEALVAADRPVAELVALRKVE